MSSEVERRSPRVRIHLPVFVRRGEGDEVQAITFDISEPAVQIRCDVATLEQLGFLPASAPHSGGATFDVSMSLPVRQPPKVVQAQCLLVWFAPIANAGGALALRFQSIRGRGADVLNRFILEAIEPAEE